MPFTASHTAAVLPFFKLNRRWVCPTALVVGSMAPDFEYFFRLRLYTTVSHTLPGVFLFDLPVTLLIATLYQLFVRDAVVRHLPSYFRKRTPAQRHEPWLRYLQQHWVVFGASALVGVASHLLWDGFTHPRPFVSDIFPFVREHVFYHNRFYRVSFVLKMLSTTLGMATVVLFASVQPVVRQEFPSQRTGSWLLFWLKVFLLGCAFVALNILMRVHMDFSPESLSRLIATAISGWLLGLLWLGMKYKLRPEEKPA